ncbi:MAG TPA: FAD:protein FMN transferase [Bacteroidales bacterium]|jgi:thiamine biosynthesis lipoprotein|nr:FAD:protein FMN transferase [Bacteroidales bacterium]MDY0160212.1 FAD:protein FMN transferase [Bacteroidales bacterium]HXK80932.1 FAD:protein FMN transferase [Bacteroidales bacterium]
MKYLFLTIVGIISILACNNFKSDNYYTCTGTTQGTFYNVTYQHSTELCLNIDSILQDFSKSLSNYDSESLISRINSNESNKADAYFTEMYEAAQLVYDKTNGAFDISIAPIANAWGFGWENKNEINSIDTSYINSLLKYVGMNNISFENGKITKKYPEIKIIGNGIAQGLSVDVVSEYLKKQGITNYLVEIGGEVYATGLNPSSDPWSIGIDKPVKDSNYEDRETQIIINFSDWSAATSGNYRKYIEIKDKSLGHSLDPRTGFPAINELLSVTVIAKKCIYADAFATAFMVLGLNESMEIVEAEDNLEAYFIYLNENKQIETEQSSGFKSFVSKY